MAGVASVPKKTRMVGAEVQRMAALADSSAAGRLGVRAPCVAQVHLHVLADDDMSLHHTHTHMSGRARAHKHTNTRAHYGSFSLDMN